MRKNLILLLLLGASAPAMAQPVPQLPPELTDPATIHQLAGALDELSRALMNIRVGEARAALEGREASPQEKNLTVRDMARRDDPNFDRNLQRQIAQVGPTMHRGVTALNQALPEVMQSLHEAKKSIERAAANMPDPTYPRR